MDPRAGSVTVTHNRWGKVQDPPDFFRQENNVPSGHHVWLLTLKFHQMNRR
jgi:hypothetical protein